jgi:squalene-associated FAD-dependent desaturase
MAGIAAALAAARHGLRVELFEARRMLGGRAGAFFEPRMGHWADFGQHVAMGCCTNLADLFRQAGLTDRFVRHRQVNFVGPERNSCGFSAVGWLPAPLHLLPGLLGLKFLSLGDRLGIGRAMLRLATHPGGDEPAIGPWLREQGQSEAALARFWSVVLVAALGAARKVFVDGFLASRTAYEVLVPGHQSDDLPETLPLGLSIDAAGDASPDWLTLRSSLERSGVTLHRGCRVRRIDGDRDGVREIVVADGSRRSFDYTILAVPWRAVRRVFSEDLLNAAGTLADVDRIEPSPIATLHLWFDRPITDLPHAAIVGRLSQWFFSRGPVRPSPAASSVSPSRCFYYEVVISASGHLVGRSRESVLAEVRSDLETLWPAARGACLAHWRMVTEPEAVFSVRPGLEAIRPPQRTAIANLMLAGDWTATGWPATMEGAVRSGYRAAEAVLDAVGSPASLVVPDLPRSRLAQWWIGGRESA